MRCQSARKVSHAVDRKDCSVLERRDEKARGDVRGVMFDAMEDGPDILRGLSHGSCELFLDSKGHPLPSDAVQNGPCRRTILQNKPNAPPKVCTRVEGNRDMIEVARLKIACFQAVTNRFGRKAGPMLDPIKAPDASP
jgi:hypothetical protein